MSDQDFSAGSSENWELDQEYLCSSESHELNQENSEESTSFPPARAPRNRPGSYSKITKECKS